MVLASLHSFGLHAATSLALSGENMPSAGWVLVTSQNTDDNDGSDNDNIISENLESGRHLQGCLGVSDSPAAPQSHSSDILPSPSKGPPGQPYRVRGESVGPWSRTKILTTIISTPDPAPERQ